MAATPRGAQLLLDICDILKEIVCPLVMRSVAGAERDQAVPMIKMLLNKRTEHSKSKVNVVNEYMEKAIKNTTARYLPEALAKHFPDTKEIFAQPRKTTKAKRKVNRAT